MKISIIHFDPYIGGETTLCNSISEIISKNHEVQILHPIHLSKRGKVIMKTGWGKVNGGIFCTYEETIEKSKDSDFIFCINGKHINGSKNSDKKTEAIKDSQDFFSRFQNKEMIFYEHGYHTWRLYDFENVFSLLNRNGNSIRVLTNTKAVIPFYESKGYNAYLCRQPFNPEYYAPIKKNNSDILNICFNSRYSTTKGPQKIFPFIDQFLNKKYKFALNFRGTIGDPVSIWHNIKHYFLENSNEIIMKKYATDISEVYDEQDYTIYAGYQTKQERGKIEYSILETIHYGIPMIAHKDYFDYFMYDEYGITREELKKCFIELTDSNMNKIMTRDFEHSDYVQNSMKILEDFLPEKILERFENCLNSPASVGKKVVSLF